MATKYHMDLDKILGKKVNFGEANEDNAENKQQKKRFDEKDFELIKAAPEINDQLDEMEDKLDNLQRKIKDVIDEKQADFFKAFQRKMADIVEEMNQLKEKAKAEKIKAAMDEKVIFMTQQRDWFQKEAVEMSSKAKKQESQYQEIKKKYRITIEERDNFHKRLCEEKLKVKEYELIIDRLKGDQIDQLKGKSSSAMRAKPLALKQSVESIKRLGKELEQIDQSQAVLQYRSLKKEILNIEQEMSSTNNVLALPYGPAYEVESLSNSMSLAVAGMQGEKRLEEENKILKLNLDKVSSLLELTRKQLNEERKKNKEFLNQKINEIVSRNELEEFFLQCIQEVKKDIARRKDTATGLDQIPIRYGGPSPKSGKSRIASAISSKTLYMKDDESKQIKYSQFQSTDKQKVVELLLQNDEVLVVLFEKLFPQTTFAGGEQPLMKLSSLSKMRIFSAGSQNQNIEKSYDSNADIIIKEIKNMNDQNYLAGSNAKVSGISNGNLLTEISGVNFKTQANFKFNPKSKNDGIFTELGASNPGFKTGMINSQSGTGLVGSSRLNLNQPQREQLEQMYSDASQYARKSFGGNTQINYKFVKPVDETDEIIQKKNKRQLRSTNRLQSVNKQKSRYGNNEIQAYAGHPQGNQIQMNLSQSIANRIMTSQKQTRYPKVIQGSIRPMSSPNQLIITGLSKSHINQTSGAENNFPDSMLLGGELQQVVEQSPGFEHLSNIQNINLKIDSHGFRKVMSSGDTEPINGLGNNISGFSSN